MVRDFKKLDAIILDIYRQTWEHRRYTAARMVWVRKDQRTPTGISWVDWWEETYGEGESFADYVQRRKRDKDT